MRSLDEIQILLPGIPARSARGFLGYCTVALLRSEEGWLLFDTGHYGDRSLLLEALSKAGLSPIDIRYVVLSHLHYDHCLNLPLFPQATVMLAKRELEYAREVFAGRRVDYAIPDFVEGLIKSRQIRFIDSELTVDSRISISETPGHTPGCVALRFQGTSSIVFCGDAIKNAWEFLGGAPSMVYGDPSAARDSIQRIKKWGTTFVPGHDRAFRTGTEGIEFLTQIEWSVTGDVYPREKDAEIFRLVT